MSGQNLDLGPTTVAVKDDSAYNAFPGIALLPNGHLIAVYRAATDHISADGVIKSQVSTDGGATWSAAATVLDTSNDLRDPEIILLPNNTLFLTYFEVTGGAVWEVRGLIGTPTGDSVSWDSSILISNDFADGGGPACSAKVIPLSNGDLLMPIYGWDTGDTHSSAGIKRSTDNGATWAAGVTLIATDATIEYSEACGVQFSNDEIVIIVRKEGVGYVRTVSTDNGATWSAPSTVIVNTTDVGRPSVVRLQSGAMAIFTRMPPTSDGRWAVSWDHGATWTAFLMWTNGPFMYASMVVLPDGTVAAAIAFESASDNADIWYQDFTGDDAAEIVATPTIDPDGGAITASDEITLACATSGATIYYTIDGSTPDSGDIEYTAPFTLASSATVKRIAIKSGMDDSAVASADFTVTASAGGGSEALFLSRRRRR